MIKATLDQLEREEPSAVKTYCMGSVVADRAAREGYVEFAKSLEEALSGLLLSLTRDEQRQALSMAYEVALARDTNETVQQPTLRLVYSRS